MTNKQHQIEIEEETTVVRILSVIFITLMILIVSSYSDIPRDKNEGNSVSQTITDTRDNNLQATRLGEQQISNIKTRLNASAQSLNNI